MVPDIQDAIRVLEASLGQLRLFLLQQQGFLPPTGSEATLLDDSGLRDAIRALRSLEAQPLLRSYFDRVFASLFGE